MSHSRTMFGILLVGLVSPTVRSPAQAQSGQLTTIYSFAGAPGDGVEPSGGVVMGANGVLYGTTTWGGAPASGTGVSGDGTVFQLTPPAATGGTWTETLLYSFSGSDGAAPRAALLIGGNGDLYGTASEGGTYGTAFELAPPAAARGVWTYTLLHNFQGGADGDYPASGLVFGLDGALYGTTSAGGAGCKIPHNAGCGTAFSLTAPTSAGGSWSEAVLYAFENYSRPSGLAVGPHGTLFLTGATENDSDGRALRLVRPKQAGAAWSETVLYSNLGATSGVILGPTGVLYGSLTLGSPYYGAIYEVVPPAEKGGPWMESIIYSFTETNGDGAYPNGYLALAPNGVLYGATRQGGTTVGCSYNQGCGTLFQLTPSTMPGGAWTETVLYTFSGGVDGAYPTGPLTIGPNGEIYGTTEFGGTSAACAAGVSGNPYGGCGTVFRFTPPTP